MSTHVFRALDGALFARDWLVRSTRRALSTTNAEHAKFFPATWSAAQRAGAAAALNAISGPASYASLSADARDLLGRVPGNEGLAGRGNLEERDWLIRHTRSALGVADGGFFPSEWAAPLKRKQAADLLNAITDRAAYRTLSNDALRVLAALPGNEAAFQQVTPQPLPNSGPSTSNRLGPDNPPSFALDPGLCAYIDRLDGRSKNRYFYRAAFIDGASNIGPLGLSSPPVGLPDVVPPRAPVFTRVLAGAADPTQPGDGKITLRWASNREPDLSAYRVYRTADAAAARDTRLMQLVHEIAVLAGDPALRPAEVVWTDAVPAALVTYSYRLVAVDLAGNVSNAAAPISARAFDTALPEVPPLTLAWVTAVGSTRAEITWNSPHEVLIQRRHAPGPWVDLAQWRAAGAVTVRDPFSMPTETYEYRAIARKATGALKRGPPIILTAKP